MTLKYRYTPIIVFFTLILFFGTISTDSFAAPSDKGQEKGKALGCEKGTAKNNKHCNNLSCDTNGDGVIDDSELSATIISDIEDLADLAGKFTNFNGIIDTDGEFEVLEFVFPELC